MKIGKLLLNIKEIEKHVKMSKVIVGDSMV